MIIVNLAIYSCLNSLWVAHNLSVSKVRLYCLAVARYMMIWYIVNFAQFLYIRRKCRQMTMVDIREQMVFDLIVQPSREVIAEQAIVSEILCCLDLMLVEILIRSMRAVHRQMIDLCVDHEANTQYGSWYGCPNDCFPERHCEVRPNMQ